MIEDDLIFNGMFDDHEYSSGLDVTDHILGRYHDRAENIRNN